MKHVVIYRENGRFAGWPANFGMWSWGDEIVVGFTLGYLDTETDYFHARDKNRPFTPYQSRSMDGGETWSAVPIPATTPGNRGFSSDDLVSEPLWVASQIDDSNRPKAHSGTVDFTDPNFALLCARTGLRTGSLSWYYTSVDRCRTWQGPYALPDFGMVGLATRTDYQILDQRSVLLFITGVKPNGREGNIFCAETKDGGQNFRFKSWVSQGRENGFSIMPSSVRLSDQVLLTATRERDVKHQGDEKTIANWIDVYRSEDNGDSWTLLSSPVPDTGKSGNPPALIRMQDGRLCLAYGNRNSPDRICIRLSKDDGCTWTDEIVLRDDGGNHDIGYPRMIQRPDGKVVTAYYFNDLPQGERYIAATIWDPNEV
jgi:hypothetical protein